MKNKLRNSVFLLILVEFLLFSCKGKNSNQNDYTVTLFENSEYKLNLALFDTINKYDIEKNNSILTFYKLSNGKKNIYFADSLYCMYPDIRFQDFNKDNVKDVLLFYSTGARANPTYHLYICDTTNKKLFHIEGFENIPNPDLDSINNIITGIGLAGNNYYSFYRITPDYKLIDLGYDYKENPSDSMQYENAINNITRKDKQIKN